MKEVTRNIMNVLAVIIMSLFYIGSTIIGVILASVLEILILIIGVPVLAIVYMLDSGESLSNSVRTVLCNFFLGIREAIEGFLSKVEF